LRNATEPGVAVVTGERSRTESGITPAYEPGGGASVNPGGLTRWSASSRRAAEAFAASMGSLEPRR
jgi:hypothetical protein